MRTRRPWDFFELANVLDPMPLVRYAALALRGIRAIGERADPRSCSVAASYPATVAADSVLSEDSVVSSEPL